MNGSPGVGAAQNQSGIDWVIAPFQPYPPLRPRAHREVSRIELSIAFIPAFALHNATASPKIKPNPNLLAAVFWDSYIGNCKICSAIPRAVTKRLSFQG
jgi:hypothetical protein